MSLEPAVSDARERCNGRVLSADAAQAVARDGVPVRPTGHECRILEYLMLHAGKIVSKTERVYDQDFGRDSNVVEVALLGSDLGGARVRLTLPA